MAYFPTSVLEKKAETKQLWDVPTGILKLSFCFDLPEIAMPFEMNLQIPKNRGRGHEKPHTQSQELPSLCYRTWKQVKTSHVASLPR